MIPILGNYDGDPLKQMQEVVTHMQYALEKTEPKNQASLDALLTKIKEFTDLKYEKSVKSFNTTGGKGLSPEKILSKEVFSQYSDILASFSENINENIKKVTDRQVYYGYMKNVKNGVIRNISSVNDQICREGKLSGKKTDNLTDDQKNLVKKVAEKSKQLEEIDYIRPSIMAKLISAVILIYAIRWSIPKIKEYYYKLKDKIRSWMSRGKSDYE